MLTSPAKPQHDDLQDSCMAHKDLRSVRSSSSSTSPPPAPEASAAPAAPALSIAEMFSQLQKVMKHEIRLTIQNELQQGGRLRGRGGDDDRDFYKAPPPREDAGVGGDSKHAFAAQTRPTGAAWPSNDDNATSASVRTADSNFCRVPPHQPNANARTPPISSYGGSGSYSDMRESPNY